MAARLSNNYCLNYYSIVNFSNKIQYSKKVEILKMVANIENREENKINIKVII